MNITEGLQRGTQKPEANGTSLSETKPDRIIVIEEGVVQKLTRSIALVVEVNRYFNWTKIIGTSQRIADRNLSIHPFYVSPTYLPTPSPLLSFSRRKISG